MHGAGRQDIFYWIKEAKYFTCLSFNSECVSYPVWWSDKRWEATCYSIYQSVHNVNLSALFIFLFMHFSFQIESVK